MAVTQYSYRITSMTHKGLVREHNEDNHAFCPNLNQKIWFFYDSVQVTEPGNSGALMILADGMGGVDAGEVASRLTIEAITDYFSTRIAGFNVTSANSIKDFLFGSIMSAHKHILNYAKENQFVSGMGTTLIIGWIYNNTLYLAWCGDSRCYILPKDAALIQLSKDHSYVQELIDKGKLTKEQAFYHPENNIITQSLGDPNHEPQPGFMVRPLRINERILFCSDGLSGLLHDHEIQNLLRLFTDQKECAAALIDKANEAGGTDNITIILCDILMETNIQIPEEKKKASGKHLFGIRYFAVLLLMTVSFFLGLYFQKIMHGINTKPSEVNNLPDSMTVSGNDALRMVRIQLENIKYKLDSIKSKNKNQMPSAFNVFSQLIENAIRTIDNTKLSEYDTVTHVKFILGKLRYELEALKKNSTNPKLSEYESFSTLIDNALKHLDNTNFCNYLDSIAKKVKILNENVLRNPINELMKIKETRCKGHPK